MEEQGLTSDLQLRVANLEAELAVVRRERELIGRITDTIDLDKLLDILVAEMERVCEFDSLMINFADKRQESLVCEKVKLPERFAGTEKTYLKYKFPMDVVDANVECYGQRRSVFVDRSNAALFEGDTALRFERSALQSLVVIPILQDDCGEQAPLGTLMLFKMDSPISPQSVAAIEQLLVLFRKQIKITFLCKEVEEHERQVQLVVEEQQRFLQFVSRINTLNCSQQIYESIATDFLRRFPFDLFAVLMCEGNELVAKKFKVSNEKYQAECAALEAYYANTHYNLELAEGASVICFQQNRLLTLADAKEVMDLPMSEKDRQGVKLMKSPRTFVIVPIRQAEKPVGIIWLISLSRPVHVSEAQLKLIELLCSFIGTALANAELYSQVQEQKKEA